MKRFAPDAGIALGPILFVLALLGVLASVLASGSGGSLGSAANTDRISADIVSQANMIRSKILECQMQYLVNGATYASSPCTNDAYPCSNQTNGTLVSALTCPNDPLVDSAEQSLWTGPRVAMLPPPTKGFNEWKYMNDGDSGGRCIWTTPTGGKTTSVTEGLTRAATKFTTDEVSYDSSNSSPKFILFITRPTPASSVNAHCAQE